MAFLLLSVADIGVGEGTGGSTDAVDFLLLFAADIGVGFGDSLAPFHAGAEGAREASCVAALAGEGAGSFAPSCAGAVALG